jgi:hypothetical protein
MRSVISVSAWASVTTRRKREVIVKGREYRRPANPAVLEPAQTPRGAK